MIRSERVLTDFSSALGVAAIAALSNLRVLIAIVQKEDAAFAAIKFAEKGKGYNDAAALRAAVEAGARAGLAEARYAHLRQRAEKLESDASYSHEAMREKAEAALAAERAAAVQFAHEAAEVAEAEAQMAAARRQMEAEEMQSDESQRQKREAQAREQQAGAHSPPEQQQQRHSRI